MNLSDSELGMLEQLTYLNGSVAEKAGIEGYSKIGAGRCGDTVGELLAQFDDAALEQLAKEKGPIAGAEASGAEWAQIIRYLKESDMSNLVLTDVMPNATGKTCLALCFEDKSCPNKGIVAFKGTTGKEEWEDNVEGLNVADTECQKEALDYINRLPYDDITVTGHSKGANKAMYVAVTSSKVTNCVAYDGQGFSQEFIDKYWAEIQLRGGNITNYSVSTDFVHILLFPVPNSKQVYCQGYGISSLPENHSPNSFFKCDEEGNLILENGEPVFVVTEEAESMTMLHKFTAFILNNADAEDKEVIVGYISQLLGIAFSGDGASKDELIDFILSDPDALALILAYLVKYMDTYNLSSKDIDLLLETLGLNSLNELIVLKKFELPFGLGGGSVNLNLVNIINYMKKQLTDRNDDLILRFIILPALKHLFAKEYDVDVNQLWGTVNDKVGKIDASGGCSDAVAKTGVVRDFSQAAYDKIIDTISRLNNMTCFSLDTWKQYYGEEWFSALDISLMMKGINGYISSIAETNQECRTKIDEVFSNVNEIDKEIAWQIREGLEPLQKISNKIKEKADMILV